MKNKKLLVCKDCHQSVKLGIYLDPNEIGGNNPIKEYIIENKPFKPEERRKLYKEGRSDEIIKRNYSFYCEGCEDYKNWIKEIEIIKEKVTILDILK